MVGPGTELGEPRPPKGDAVRIGLEKRRGVGEIRNVVAAVLEEGAERRPIVDLPGVLQPRHKAKELAVVGRVLVRADRRLRKGALEQRKQDARSHGDEDAPALADFTDDVGERVREHDFVAEALLGDKKDALSCERLPRPERQTEAHDRSAAEAHLVTHVPGGETFLEAAKLKKAERARVLAFGALVGQSSKLSALS